MGQHSKTQKGDISISNFEGRIRLRWRVEGKRYSLNLPLAHSPENISQATVKVAEIKLDILKGCFDTSLLKYKPSTKQISNSPAPLIPTITTLGGLVEKFNDWTKQIRNIDIMTSFDYLYIRKLLEKWQSCLIEGITQKLSGEKWAVTTYNRRITYLRQFFDWLKDSGTISQNPLSHVTRRREKKKKKNERRKPLTEAEISILLEAIWNNTYCRQASRYKHSFYYPFLRFVFLTGVRNAEAIGLRVKHVQFSEQRIEISEAFARTVKGTNHAARISKGTKMGNVRYLPLTEELQQLLSRQTEGKEPEDFVFPSPKGLSIDDRMLEKRILKPVLKALGLGDRDLYAARHSFGTRAVQQGMPLTEVAYLMGHSTIETAIRNYVSADAPSNMLPNLRS